MEMLHRVRLSLTFLVLLHAVEVPVPTWNSGRRGFHFWNQEQAAATMVLVSAGQVRHNGAAGRMRDTDAPLERTPS